jgi:hypothetical protein
MICLTLFTHEGCSSGDVLVPMHSIVNNPIHEGILFASTNVEKTTTRKIHTGTPRTEEINGTFINAHGDFLVLSKQTFLILTPKSDVFVGDVLLPKHSTHTLVMAQKGSVHRIKPGASIVCVLFRSNTLSLVSTSIFLPSCMNPFLSNVIRDRTVNAMLAIVNHMAEIMGAVYDKSSQTIVVSNFEAFKPSRSSESVFSSLQPKGDDGQAKRQKTA